MRNLFTSLRAFAPMTAALALLISSPAAQAANPLELNFGLFGPKYDGRVAECERALSTIASQFQEKESKFWNSALVITGFGRIQETAFRPWQSDNIPRRYCSGDVMLSDGKMRTDGNLGKTLTYNPGFGQGVEWCVTGLDRNWAYSPGCRAARP